MIFESDKDVIIFLPSNMHINHIFQHLIEISLEYEKYYFIILFKFWNLLFVKRKENKKKIE